MSLEFFDDIPKWYRIPYKETCSGCDKIYTIYTQDDDEPEYYTNIYLECSCGHYVDFSLPVN